MIVEVIDMKKYIERLFDKELDFYLKTVGAIQIVGPKWWGKSKIAKRHAKKRLWTLIRFLLWKVGWFPSLL